MPEAIEIVPGHVRLWINDKTAAVNQAVGGALRRRLPRGLEVDGYPGQMDLADPLGPGRTAPHHVESGPFDCVACCQQAGRRSPVAGGGGQVAAEGRESKPGWMPCAATFASAAFGGRCRGQPTWPRCCSTSNRPQGGKRDRMAQERLGPASDCQAARSGFIVGLGIGRAEAEGPKVSRPEPR
jgi:hypothetical protein